MNGPLDTERDARALPEVEAIWEAFRADPGTGKMRPLITAMLEQACESAGVELGDYDHRILRWLAGFEPQTAAVVASLITRAAGRDTS